MNSNLLIGLALLSAPVWGGTTISENIIQNMAGSAEFLISLYYVVGLGLIFAGISGLKKLGNRTAFMNADSGVVGPLAKMIIGALLIFFPNFLEVLNKTLFNNTAIENASALLYQGSPSYITHLRPIIIIIQFIGMVAILRGFLILTKATGQGAQPGTISKGFVHILGGVMAVNITKTVSIVVTTFGGSRGLGL